MKIIVYALTMVKTPPNKRWHLEGNAYYDIRIYADNDPCLPNVLRTPHHYYDLRDGWGISVSVYETTSALHVARIMRATRGFLCYTWMIDSIERHGTIRQVLPTLSYRREDAIRTEVL